MINPKLRQEKKQVDDLFDQISVFSGDPFFKSLLTYYLCIRVSGFLENCVRIIFNDYSFPRSEDKVKSYMEKKLSRFPNPNWQSIAEITADFDDNWAKSLKGLVNEQSKESVNSINANRNAIAHGGNSNITFIDLTNYYNDVIQVLDILESICK